jgi:uncharacterized repeat protein (TIGR03803 family)
MLYGTTGGGGNNGGGTLFTLNADGSGYRILYHFGGGSGADGSPSVLVEGFDGALYGTTENGGTNGSGAVYRVNKDGTGYQILHHFSGWPVDGGSPTKRLVWGSDGKLYGSTRGGGSDGRGTVFKMNPDGSGYGVMRSFGGDGDGLDPSGGLLEANDGALYGTTYVGGTSGNPFDAGGVVFKINKDGSGYQILHHFLESASDGNSPYAALLQGTDGFLYGSTYYGGSNGLGVVFRLKKDGTGYDLLHHFNGSPNDGSSPQCPLAEGNDGRLYGTTSARGAVFALNKDGTGYEVLRWLTGPPGVDGFSPMAGLLERDDGALLGTTQDGGTNGFGGTLFRLNKDGSGYGLLRSFGSSSAGGDFPDAALLEASNGALYGTTQFGGQRRGGTLFKVNRDGTSHTVLHHFGSISGDGRNPQSKLVEGSDGALYGTTDAGGMSWGTVFKMNKDGSGYLALKKFGYNSPDGSNPTRGLVAASDGRLYGVAYYGGSGGKGSLFRLNTNGADFVVLLNFNGGNGHVPNGLMEGSDGALYGTTGYGGITNVSDPYGRGTVYRLNLDGTGHTILHRFGSIGSDGSFPSTGLMEGSDGAIYGTTEGGGNFNEGTVFQLNKNGTGYILLHHFASNSTDGGAPSGGLAEGPDGALYGTARHGGGHGVGTLFKLNKNGSGFTTLHHFSTNSANGQFPRTGLSRGNDGAFYGTTADGGEMSLGSIFKLSWPVAITRYERSGNTAQLGWNGVPNWPYRIQARTNLSALTDDWADIGTNTTSLDGTCQLSVSETPYTPARFYRIAWP